MGWEWIEMKKLDRNKFGWTEITKMKRYWSQGDRITKQRFENWVKNGPKYFTDK